MSSGDKAHIQLVKATRSLAEQLAKEQSRRRQGGLPAIPATEVITKLLDPEPKAREDDLLFACDSEHGRRALSVLSVNRNGVTIRLHSGSGASRDELAEMLRAALAHLESHGKLAVG